MPRLSEGQKYLLMVGSVLLILLVLALVGYLSGRWDQAEGQPLPASKWDKRIAELDREALEEAYKERVVHLFEVWMKDDTGQPGRATTGVRNARKAFVEAMERIDKANPP